MATHPAIEAALSSPATHEVVVSYSNGVEEAFALRNAGVAEKRADFFRKRMGRDLTATNGATVRIDSVNVREIAA